MDNAILAYITCADHAEAERIGRTLVQERLAACVNIFDHMHSIYHWEGALEDGRESVLLCKTRVSLGDRLTARVRELHSYTTPCVLLVPTAGGNPEYLEWIMRETIK